MQYFMVMSKKVATIFTYYSTILDFLQVIIYNMFTYGPLFRYGYV